MGLITVNTENFKIAEPPERPKTEVKSVQTADELVASFPEVFQRELGALPGTGHHTRCCTASPCPNVAQKQTEGRIGLTTAIGGHSSNL